MPASVDLVQADLAVQPGEAISTTVRLMNTGRIVDELSLEVLGAAAAYATIAPSQVPLFPGARGEATITFRPPRGTTPAAGTVPFGIRVRSQEDRSFSFVVEGRVRIGAVMDVGAHLSPRSSVASRMGQGATHRIEVSNNSNVTATIRVAAADADERLLFRVAQPVLTIPAGGRAVTAVAVKGRKRMMTGAQAMIPFQVSVATDGAPPILLDGTMAQRPTLLGGATQILTVAVVIGVAGVLATQALPLLNPAAATAPPATAQATTAVASEAPTPGPTEAPASEPVPTQAPASTSGSQEPAATPEPSTPPPATASPTAEPTASPTPAPPLSIRILNLGLVDPQGLIPEQTPLPDTTPAPGGSFRPCPSFPIRLMNSGVVSGGTIALAGPFTQEAQAGLPVQQFGLQVTGPVQAQLTRVNNGTTPNLCLVPAGGAEACKSDNQTLAGTPPGTDAQTWFLSVVAQQGGTSVDVKVDYAPQPVTFGFKDLHLAGVSATSGVHLVIQASAAGLIEIFTEVSLSADVTVNLRDLNTQLAAPPSTTPAGGTGSTFVAAAEPGHLYDILITSSSPDEVFVSGTISWP